MTEAKAKPTIDRKGRLKIPPQKIPQQAPEERVRNWDEVSLGFDAATAVVEATRCIQCPAAPCTKACPLHNDIAGALLLLEQGDFIGAANKFRETSTMPEICGRICPQERLCEGSCVVAKNNLPVAIGKLEAFVADYQRRTQGFPVPSVPSPTGKRVAVVGAGPAGLTVAEELAKKGHAVTVYDAWPEPGGILLYGIPNFKLSKEIVAAKIALLKQLGVCFVPDTLVGRDVSVAELLPDGYHAVFLGYGAGLGVKLEVPGEDLEGVYTATDFLVRENLPGDLLPPEQRQPLALGRKVAVVGGGDTAMDCVRTALRLGAEEVTCVYRRTEAEMPGRQEEREHAKEEGVRFLFLAAPLRFLGDERGHVRTMACLRMELGEPDASGRRRPVPVAGSEFVIEVDIVVLALGYTGAPLIPHSTPGLESQKGNLIVIERETGQTSLRAVYAGGDSVNGPDLVVTAVADGKRAAAALDRFLSANR